MLDPIEEDVITIGLERIDRIAVELYSPVCIMCGDSITEKDIHCIRIDISASNKIERMHDSEDCFNMYVTALSYYYAERPNDLQSSRVQ